MGGGGRTHPVLPPGYGPAIPINSCRDTTKKYFKRFFNRLPKKFRLTRQG